MSAQWLHPCICGNTLPFNYAGCSCVFIACHQCGLELADSEVRTYWPDGNVPLALERYAYHGDGWPDGSRFVSACGPLVLYGHAERWNKLMRSAKTGGAV